ncbi:MAG: hypothetical protein A2513_02530 [Sulfurimonas sp. RIFOXYD12_FULL_33_39]|uniref:DUF2018 family protein n=1 Tax=unclassified Sulfurimonas TaxID=2623549 RepID=UPI0008CFDC2E|nr:MULTISPECIES: DUF2018 family protein [unclassified Sulfurimonas]OHE08880.1 MAG: hypothetical protein A2513_02530 [Sulfurimonas sp. RIFOXYD12_FULL_33_39]OHE14190.1 MAG: hypothetical protein A2530_05830 [Sulfurimonas sp. RIFOXYD2_FULL_34_21]DAB28172.1 MAG TPA: hypothetical protein CFH78_03880 [Sulfurimonas sp. UBA10385]
MYGLFEDEDDIFMGSPKSKLMDVVFNANNDVVRYQLQNFIDRTAAIELMIGDKLGEDMDREIQRFMISNRDEVDNHAKSLYIELMGAILSQSE